MPLDPPAHVRLLFNKEGRLMLSQPKPVEDSRLPEGWSYVDYVHLSDLFRQEFHTDDPEFDATDAAHPAWRRGVDHGVQKAARLLVDIAIVGSHGGAFADPALEAAARAILDLRLRLKEGDESFKASNELYNAHLKELEAKLARMEELAGFKLG